MTSLVGLRAAGEQDPVVGDAELGPRGVCGSGEDEQGEEREKWTHRTVKRRATPSELRCNQQMATTDVSEREARQVAEAAREQEWKLPSFGKELFLGNYRLDLIHPQPRLDAEATEKGERFLATLREFLENEVDPLLIERESKIPDEVIEGLKRIGAMGMKVAEDYGGLGLSQVYYNRALAMIGTWHAALGALRLRAPVDRRRRAAADVRHRRAEARVAAARGAHATSRPSC